MAQTILQKNTKLKQLMDYTFLYVAILESQKSVDEACELLEELYELSEKYNFSPDSIQSKLERLQDQLGDS